MAASEQHNLYVERINRVMDTIAENLTADWSLAALADVAGFSPFHFHRVFSTLTGEPLKQFIWRARVERAAALLRATPDASILDAALACGYESASGFSRAFRKHFGLSPRQWDRQTPLKNSKNGQVLDGFPRYAVENLRAMANDDGFTVQLRALPPQRLAYIRVHDSYGSYQRIVGAFEQLMAWVAARGGDVTRMAVYGMSQDDPETTPLKKCRFDWCVAVPNAWRAGEGVSIRAFPACTLAAIHAQGDIYRMDRAWQYLWRYWLPRSRYQPANLPAMEIYRRLPLDLGWETYDMDCAIPVVPFA